MIPKEKIQGVLDTKILEDCTLCPRNCHVNRAAGGTGYCGQTDELMVARAALHQWEEPCISGQNGSGTVFFSGCSLGCVFCQNHPISRGEAGKQITPARLSGIFIELQQQLAHNINLVTPTHFIPQILEAISIAREKGLCIPVVYNSGGYEKPEMLKLLEGYVDIYLPDLKYRSPKLSKRYSGCTDYFSKASTAIAEMVRQAGKPVFDEDGIMKSGVIVRHLVLPGCIYDSMQVIKYLYETYGNDIYISIMNQYTPMAPAEDFPELKRKVTDAEYDEVVEYALSIGVENGFIQEGETALESFIPCFDGEGV